MTRNEARMIAEELAHILKGQIQNTIEKIVTEEREEYIDSEQVAKMLNISKSSLYHSYRDVIPCRKIGRNLMYKKSAVIAYINR